MRIVLAAKPGADQPWLADAVISLSRQTGATVAVVSFDEVELERLVGAPREVFAERARTAVDTMVRRLTDAGIEASGTTLPGRPLPGIPEFADDQRADLIMVGSSSRPAVAERLLGSVPMDLLKKSSRPVVVVTHPDQAR